LRQDNKEHEPDDLRRAHARDCPNGVIRTP
jgi:hypothetical protein